MSFYLYQLSYSSEAIKALVAKPSDREAAARKLIEAAGGKLHHLFFSMGKYDVVCLTECPNDKVAMAVSAAAAAAGTVSHSATTKLMTAAEAMEAMALAGKAIGSYKAPMN
jgi:uncharacterized protein with GYD domain